MHASRLEWSGGSGAPPSATRLPVHPGGILGVSWCTLVGILGVSWGILGYPMLFDHNTTFDRLSTFNIKLAAEPLGRENEPFTKKAK